MTIRKELIIATAIATTVFLMAYHENYPLNALMNWGAQMKAGQSSQALIGNYELYDALDNVGTKALLIDVKSGIHFWHPQVVVWIEDTAGNFVQTLFITESSAKGLFMSGRTADNFKSFDQSKNSSDLSPEDLRLVDALPFWSHRRGKKTLPGFYAPTFYDPEVDGMTGATPQGSFYFRSAMADTIKVLNLWLEVNVAFDDNEFYSEYDFPDDSLYHGGTGLLGQPSLVYKTTIDQRKHQLMELMGHAHHSGQNGELYSDLSTITTAKKILDRIVVGWE